MSEKLEKLFEKYLAKDAEDRHLSELLHTPGGIRQTNNNPYDRLKRSLKRIFPGYPDVFDYGASAQDE